MLYRVLSVLFIVLGQIRIIWAFSKCFRNFTSHLFEVAPRRCDFAGLRHSARTDFRNNISPSLFVKITHMICRWKALSKIFNLKCNMLYKTAKNLHVNQPQNSASFCLNSNGSEFPRFRCIRSHCSQFTYISNKSSIKTKIIVF